MKNYDWYPQQLISQALTLAGALILLAFCIREHAPLETIVTAVGLLLASATQQKTGVEKKKAGITIQPPPGAGPISPELAQMVNDLVYKHSVPPVAIDKKDDPK